MQTASAYTELYFGVEDEEAQDAREYYNYRKGLEAQASTASGFERLAIEMEMSRLSVRTSVRMRGERSRRNLLQMPTIAGVAEIAARDLMKTQRSSALWDVCRIALQNGTFAEMAAEMGLKRKIPKTLGEKLLPLLPIDRQKSTTPAVSQSHRPTTNNNLLGPLHQLRPAPLPSYRSNDPRVSAAEQELAA